MDMDKVKDTSIDKDMHKVRDRTIYTTIHTHGHGQGKGHDHGHRWRQIASIRAHYSCGLTGVISCHWNTLSLYRPKFSKQGRLGRYRSITRNVNNVERNLTQEYIDWMPTWILAYILESSAKISRRAFISFPPFISNVAWKKETYLVIII